MSCFLYFVNVILNFWPNFFPTEPSKTRDVMSFVSYASLQECFYDAFGLEMRIYEFLPQCKM